MALEDKDKRIERYLAKEMSRSEEDAFEQEVNEDADLRKDVLAHQLTQEAINLLVEDDVREKMKAIKKSKLTPPVIPIWEMRSFQVLTAACIVGLVIISYLLIPTPFNDQKIDQLAWEKKLSEELPIIMPARSLNRGSDTDILWQGCTEYFAREKYAKALACFQSKDSSTFDLQWYIAHSHLGLKQMKEANLLFEQLLKLTDLPPGSDHHTLLEYNWMLTLAWLEDERLSPKLDSVLSIPTYKYYNKAQILKDLLEDRK